jgi:hypothetical protein
MGGEMKFTFGVDEWTKSRLQRQWHEYFAWYPIKIGVRDDGKNEHVWFETVLRKKNSFNNWEYKLKDKANE